MSCLGPGGVGDDAVSDNLAIMVRERCLEG